MNSTFEDLRKQYLNKMVEEMEQEAEDEKQEAIKEIILQIKNIFEIPLDMNDEDLKKLFAPYFEEDRWGDLDEVSESELTLKIVIQLLTDLSNKGFKVKAIK